VEAQRAILRANHRRGFTDGHKKVKHRVHHSDIDLDVTTGARFHPLEILLSLGIKFLVIVSIGAPPLAVLLFEIGLNATSMFNHDNVRVARDIERVLRWFVVPREPGHRVEAKALITKR
jgi:sterol desaturase/sphingolipid hydroxylase (fatty acid hydroxylase superfamily)